MLEVCGQKVVVRLVDIGYEKYFTDNIDIRIKRLR